MQPGTRLGPYEIVAPLGAGGMGEVYRARDTRLGRDVALKILSPDVASDPGRRQRFELEARAVAALNHPNIVAIYDVGEGYIVSELVDGESLRGVKFSLRKTLDVAVQIAAGLAAAHEAGITHRDLKPDNILLTRDGRVKILDFGLAKMAGSRSGAVTVTETLTVETEPGMVLGTIGYMSPEQVRGQAADHRSDIFNFGLIVHELLNGKRVFHGDTHVETMTAILKEDAPELPETVPAGVRQIVAHCLEKDPASRFQSAKDLGFALSQFERPSGTSAVRPVKVRIPRKIVGPLAAAVAVVAAVFATHALWRAPAPPQWSGTMLGGPEMALDPRISPDGHLLAFQAFDRGLSQVALMKPESGNWSILTHRLDLGSTYTITWSSDGALIYYDRDTDVLNGIYSVPVLGGDERLLLPNAGFPEALPDGSLLAVRINAGREYQLYRFWPQSGRLQALPVITPTLPVTLPIRFLPESKEAILPGRPMGSRDAQFRLLALDLSSNRLRLVSRGASEEDDTAFTVTPDGQSILTARYAGSLTRVMAIPAHGTFREWTLFTVTSYIWHMDGAPDGAVYASLVDRPADVVRLSPDGGGSERIASFPRLVMPDLVVLLPDGRAVAAVEVSGHARLMAAATGKDPEPLLNTAEEVAAPMTLAGPRRIACTIGPEPRETIAVADFESGSVVSRIAPAKGRIDSLTASADGRTVYFAAGGAIWAVASSGGAARTICVGDSSVMEPDGKNLLVERNEASRIRLFHVPLNGGPEREIPLDPSFPLMGWPLSPNALDAKGRLLVTLTPRDSWFNPIGILDTASGRITRVPADELSDHQSAAWTPDGHIVTIQLGLRAALWKFTPEAR